MLASTTRPSLEVVASHGDWDTLLANAVRVLTDAARLRRSVLEQDDDGTWSPSAKRTEQADWAEFVTLAVAGAAANVGSTEIALAGRPGSWEAEAVRSMLASTVGVDDEHLMDHRREPIRVTVCVEDMLEGTEIARQYDEAFDAADAQDWAEHVAHWKPFEQLVWQYRREEPGCWVALDPEAPPFSLEEWRKDQRRQGMADQQIQQAEGSLNEPDAAPAGRTAYICRSAFARSELIRLEREEDERPDPAAELEQRQLADYTAYGEAFKAEILKEAELRYPGVPIRVTVEVHATASLGIGDDAWGTPEAQLIEHARLSTRLPGAAASTRCMRPQRTRGGEP